MSYVREIARDALKTAHADLVKARGGLLLAAGAVALGILAWIGLTVLQVKDASIDAPLAPRISGAIATLLVIFAAFWDGAAIRRLAAQLRG